METYYKPEDLPKFEEIGKNSPDLAKSFSITTVLSLKKVNSRKERNA